MIIFPILLAIFTWLFILWLFNQHKYLNIFEQLTLWFVAALSIFVFELFIWGMIFDKLSLLWPIVTFIICLWLIIYKNNKHKWFIKEIIQYVKSDFTNLKNQFKSLKNWRQYIIIWIIVYVLLKLFMVFSINIHMPTYDDDAVTTWDMKTKIFSANQSMVLDKSSPEYLGSDYARYPFASIIDTYFLIPYWDFVNGLSNIISPLMYLFSILMLFGIFLRKTNLFWAILSVYVFTSLPFIFIHWFGAYWNFASGIPLFMLAFYLIDQLLPIQNKTWNNINIILPLSIVAFLSSIMRSESLMLTAITFLMSILFGTLLQKKNITYANLKYFTWPFLWILLWYIIEKYAINLYPAWSVIGWTSSEMFSIGWLMKNIQDPWVFLAPFQQMFFHPDYILLFWLFFISIVASIFYHKKMKNLIIRNIISISLICIFILILYITPVLWLVTHFAFIRYPSLIILFIIYVVVYTGYNLYTKENI